MIYKYDGHVDDDDDDDNQATHTTAPLHPHAFIRLREWSAEQIKELVTMSTVNNATRI